MPASAGNYTFVLAFRNYETTPCTYLISKRKVEIGAAMVVPWLLFVLITIYAIRVLKHRRRRPKFQVDQHVHKLYADQPFAPVTFTATVTRSDEMRFRWFVRDEKNADLQKVYMFDRQKQEYIEVPYNTFVTGFPRKADIKWADALQFKRENLTTDLLIKISPQNKNPKTMVHMAFQWTSEYGIGNNPEDLTVAFFDTLNPKPQPSLPGSIGALP